MKNSLPRNQILRHLLSPDRYYEVECPSSSLSDEQEKMIEEVRECVVHTVQGLYHWGEEIPISWAKFEDILKNRKEERVLERSTLQGLEELRILSKSDIDDMLQFFHEIGQIIYFADEKLRDVIVIDVQWFVDGFKNIITDPKHLARETDEDEIKRGRITMLILKRIWKKETEKPYVPHMNSILPYMEKLGLMVEMKTKKGQNAEDKEFYIPSMNKVDMSSVAVNTINAGQKTSILIFHFKTYLPHFFFFRLVVRCFKEWDVLSEKMFYKNVAFYKKKDHCIAIAVNKTSIQLQVFTRSREINLSRKRVMKIRKTTENNIWEITKTFHKQVKFDRGYSCKGIKIGDEDQGDFFLQSEILPVKRETPNVQCPLHVEINQTHEIDTHTLLRFWNSEVM